MISSVHNIMLSDKMLPIFIYLVTSQQSSCCHLQLVCFTGMQSFPPNIWFCFADSTNPYCNLGLFH
jgi:hypothetical protein